MNKPCRCLIVVVLYRLRAQDSQTVQGIVDVLRSNRAVRDAYEVLLWDNTPGDSLLADDLPLALDLPCRYEQARVNDGVAGAYNAAMRICIREGYEWMLLLDQDTVVTEAYLTGMLRYQESLQDFSGEPAAVAAIVPLLLDQDFQLSPKQVLRFRDQPVAPARPRMLTGETFAANSGVMLRVSALMAIGGYSLDFWLDHSDMYVFHQFYLQRRTVFFAADLALQHSMTMLDYDGSMSPERYQNFLFAEQAFFDLYKSVLENVVYVLRLCVRCIRQRRRYSNKTYSSLTLQFLFRRLRTSKTRRLAVWRSRAVERHQGGGHANMGAAG